MAKKRTNNIPASFPFYPDDWLASTKRALMSPAERGAYIDLLAHQWNDPTCTLPDDDVALAALSGLGADWPKHASRMRQAFVPHKINGRIHNEKLSRKRAEALSFLKKASKRGKIGAQKRWEAAHAQDVTANPIREAKSKHGDASSTPQAMLGDGSPVPFPGPHPLSIKRGGKRTAAPHLAGSEHGPKDTPAGPPAPADLTSGRPDPAGAHSERPESAGADEAHQVRITVEAFENYLIPNNAGKAVAVVDLRRQQVSHVRIREMARANQDRADFFAVIKALRNGRTVEPARPEPKKPEGPKCTKCDGTLYVEADELLPGETSKRWGPCPQCKQTGVEPT